MWVGADVTNRRKPPCEFSAGGRSTEVMQEVNCGPWGYVFIFIGVKKDGKKGAGKTKEGHRRGEWNATKKNREEVGESETRERERERERESRRKRCDGGRPGVAALGRVGFSQGFPDSRPLRHAGAQAPRPSGTSSGCSRFCDLSLDHQLNSTQLAPPTVRHLSLLHPVGHFI